MDVLAGIEIFVQVGRHGSFAAAAKSLGLSPSAVSKAISRLEQRLNTQLIIRTTRALTLTDDGMALFNRADNTLLDLQNAQEFILNGASSPRGTLRISMPVMFGASHIAPLLPAFLERYPELRVETHSTDSMSELVTEGFDLVIRTGELPDSDLVARRLLNTRFMTCASPEYLNKHGVPQHPKELAQHHCCCYVFPTTGRVFKWPFLLAGVVKRVEVTGKLHFSHAEALIQSGLNGGGLVHLQDYMLQPWVDKGLLQPVLEDYQCDGGPVSAVYLKQQHLSAKVRVFVDYCRDALSG